MAAAEFARRLASLACEKPGEVGGIDEAQSIGDLGHRQAGVDQPALGFEHDAVMDHLLRGSSGVAAAQRIKPPARQRQRVRDVRHAVLGAETRFHRIAEPLPEFRAAISAAADTAAAMCTEDWCVLTVYAYTEFSEGGSLWPTVVDGTGRLDAFTTVFGNRTRSRA